MYLSYRFRDAYLEVKSIDMPQNCMLKFWKSMITGQNQLVIDLRGINLDIKILDNVDDYLSIFLNVIKENNLVYEKQKDCSR